MYRYTDSSELQDCPAAVDMETGDIWINSDVWDLYTEAEKRFIIDHELGHYKIPTDSEIEADEYALKKNFGKIKDSLRSSITALEKTRVLNVQRWSELYENALKIDAANGNERAAIELEKINCKSKNRKKMRNIPGQITYLKSRQEPVYGFNRADGFENEAEDNNPASESIQYSHQAIERRGNGIQVGGIYLKVTDIILITIAVILLVKLK